MQLQNKIIKNVISCKSVQIMREIENNLKEGYIIYLVVFKLCMLLTSRELSLKFQLDTFGNFISKYIHTG